MAPTNAHLEPSHLDAEDENLPNASPFVPAGTCVDARLVDALLVDVRLVDARLKAGSPFFANDGSAMRPR
jgi:hypothetical protein